MKVDSFVITLAIIAIIVSVVAISASVKTIYHVNDINQDSVSIEYLSGVKAELKTDIVNVEDDMHIELGIARRGLYENLEKVRTEKSAKIYNLDITVCKMNETTKNIDKKHVIMNNIVAINPSVERTAVYVDTGLLILNGPLIPGVSEDKDSYACALRIISVR